MFHALLENEISKRGISVREASRQIGVSHTGLIHVMQGHEPTIDMAKKICKWMGVNPAIVFEEPDSAVYALVAQALEEVPPLLDVFREAATSLSKGEITPDDFKEFVAFVTHKINWDKERAVKSERKTMQS